MNLGEAKTERIERQVLGLGHGLERRSNYDMGSGDAVVDFLFTHAHYLTNY